MGSKIWRYAHASVIGSAHLAQNTVCQDRFSCRTIETASGKVLIALIADGAGSTSDGHNGAELACRLFTDEIASFLESKNASIKSLNRDFGKRWILYFQQKLCAEAQANGKTVRDYASTFLGAVVGEESAAFFQVGDGAIVISDSGAQESYHFALAPHESEYVNASDFLTDDAAPERLRFELIDKEIEDLILFSDGIFPIAVNYKTNQPYEPFLLPMIAPLRNGGAISLNEKLESLNEKLESFLQTAKVNERTDDDKTIILASRA
ncbi:MAG TPA: PP2C family serine/threonine-protein phosphatase [Pyrinomonadaceae bacterium]|jgi:hypothetical protein